MTTSGATCGYLFCGGAAVSPAPFDFSSLSIRGLNAQTPFCSGHLDLLSRRVAKAHVGVAGADPVDRQAKRRLQFFQRKLWNSPARAVPEALTVALTEVVRAIGPGVSRSALAGAWAGLQLAIEESRRRRWNARQTAEWVEVVAFYKGLCAHCEEQVWALVYDGLPVCNSCRLAAVPRRKHRLLEIQENRQSRRIAVA